MNGERRRHPRRAEAHWAFCYVDGTRFDARTMDIGAGGAFLATNEQIDVGTLLVVATQHESQAGHPMVLVGRILRRQERPVEGYGVAWLRVVSEGDEAATLDFLARFLGIRSRGDVDFRRHGRRVVGVLHPLAAGEGPPEPSDPAPVAEAGPPAPAELDARETVQGVITQTLTRPHFVAEARVPARMRVGATSADVIVRGVGHHRLLVLTDLVPARRSADIEVVLRLPGEPGVERVAIVGQMAGVAPVDGEEQPGLVLAISDVDHSGAYRRFIRTRACDGFMEVD